MPRSTNQKLKLLCLCRLLWERTDEDHPMTVPELIQGLEEWDIKAERKSIYDDMEALRVFGLDVQNRKGKDPGSSSCWWTRCSPPGLSPSGKAGT